MKRYGIGFPYGNVGHLLMAHYSARLVLLSARGLAALESASATGMNVLIGGEVVLMIY